MTIEEKRTKRVKRRTNLIVGLVSIALLPALVSAPSGPPFDFSDAFYRANGLEPTLLLNRVNGKDGKSVFGITKNSGQRSVRVIETTGGWDGSGDLLYYSVFAMMMPDVFTPDDAGVLAREIANEYRAFLFPKAKGLPLSPALPNRRQDNVFDTRGGYFSNNPLGLWVLTFVSFTDEALYTREGQKELAKYAKKNGVDLDGTPILTSASDIDKLADKGLVALTIRAEDGSQGFPWVV